MLILLLAILSSVCVLLLFGVSKEERLKMRVYTSNLLHGYAERFKRKF